MAETGKKFEQTAAILRREILRGEYRNELPSERRLAAQFGISYMTMRRAIGTLVDSGLLTREHGRGVYVNTPGRRLQRTYAIGMIVPERIIGTDGKLSPFYSDVFAGATRQAAAAGYHILLDYDIDNLIRIENGKRKVDALIVVCPDEWSKLAEVATYIPVIVAGSDEPCENYPTIYFDNFSAARRAVDYLIGNGHRRIAVIYPTEQVPAFYRRLCGARRALEDHGLDYRLELSLNTCSFDRIMSHLTAADDIRPTACFCTNDMLAVNLLSHFYARGLRIPDYCSIVGFDDLDISVSTCPPLTTVKVPKVEMGALAVRKILRYSAGQLEPADFREALPLNVVIRQSTKENKQ